MVCGTPSSIESGRPEACRSVRLISSHRATTWSAFVGIGSAAPFPNTWGCRRISLSPSCSSTSSMVKLPVSEAI